MDSYTWLPPGASNASARYQRKIQTHPLSTSPLSRSPWTGFVYEQPEPFPAFALFFLHWPFHFPHRLEREGFGQVSMLTCDGEVGVKGVAWTVGKDDKTSTCSVCESKNE